MVEIIKKFEETESTRDAGQDYPSSQYSTGLKYRFCKQELGDVHS